MQKFIRVVSFIVVFTTLIATIATVQAVTESLSVPAGKDFVRKIDMATGDKIRISFTVLSQSPSSLHFWIVFPNGTTKNYGESSNFNINFASNFQGVIEMHFDNTNSTSAQLVTLNYEVEHFYFGIPELPFLIIVICVLLLCIVAGYIIMGKYS